MNTEEWKPVVGFEDHYIVSNKGRVKRISFTQRTDIEYISGTLTSHGYRVVTFTVLGKCHRTYMHRVVASAFLPNPESRPQVNHIDGDGQNNTVDNLEWVTAQGNLLHRSRVLGKERGDNHHAATLNTQQVMLIRYLIRDGRKNREIAKQVGVPAKKISELRSRKIWSHIP